MEKRDKAIWDLMGFMLLLVIPMGLMFYLDSELKLIDRGLADLFLIVGFAALFFGLLSGYGISKAIQTLKH